VVAKNGEVKRTNQMIRKEKWRIRKSRKRGRKAKIWRKGEF